MKPILSTLCLCAFLAPASQGALIITGVYDGPLPGGDPKGVELFATDAIPDLSIYGLETASNGGPSGGAPEDVLPAVSLAAGDFYYVANLGDGDFSQWFGFGPNHLGANGSVNHNGDDTILLYQSGAVVDAFGELGVDGTGTAWDSLDGWAYRNNGVGANGGTFDANDWSFSGPNAWDGDDNVGGGFDNGTNATATPPFPTGSYLIPEPSVTVLGGLALLFLLRRRK